ncbi:MAG: T9SS type A sorting domain-containing protein, partial [Candidatus Cloacimonetes bacterium]|nr:T9SS type A sorting domain-containing protein [Candidatus Cloacimonadota bacterium]
NSGAGSSSPLYFTEYNNKLWFSAVDGTNGYELWVTDGTTSGTEKLMPEIAPMSDPLGNTIEFKIYNGSLYFRAGYTTAGNELWKLTTEGTEINNPVESPAFNLYPNPVHNEINIDIPEEIENIIIYDITGKIVLNNVTGKTIDISDFVEGTYFIKITVSDKVRIQKFVKVD